MTDRPKLRLVDASSTSAAPLQFDQLDAQLRSCLTSAAWEHLAFASEGVRDVPDQQADQLARDMWRATSSDQRTSYGVPSIIAKQLLTTNDLIAMREQCRQLLGAHYDLAGIEQYVDGTYRSDKHRPQGKARHLNIVR